MFRQSLLFFLLYVLFVAPASAQTIYAAGSTIAAPLYAKWAQEYKEKTSVTIIYQAIGSNITGHAIDFAVSDAPMNANEVAAAPGIIPIPTAAYAVVLVYNLPGTAAILHLTGPVAADIFTGKITRWNDPRIVRLNPGVPLPDLGIFTVHQSNGSGTTYLLTTYFSAVSPAWKESLGAGKSIHWPVGLGRKQGMGVSQMVERNAGALGYLELSNATRSGLPIALFNSRAPKGNPIAGYLYLLVYPNARPAVKCFVQWVLTEGQADAAPMGYAPLPLTMRKLALAALK